MCSPQQRFFFHLHQKGKYMSVIHASWKAKYEEYKYCIWSGYFSEHISFHLIYLQDPVDLGWEPYVKTWLESFTEIIEQNDIEYLESLFHCSIKRGLEFLNQHKKMQAFPIHEMGIVMNICRIIGSFIHIMKQNNGLQSGM